MVAITSPETLQWPNFPFIRAEDMNGSPVFHAICLFPEMWHSTTTDVAAIIVSNNDNLVTSLANMVASGVRHIRASNRIDLFLDELHNTYYLGKYMAPAEYLWRLVHDTAGLWEASAYDQS